MPEHDPLQTALDEVLLTLRSDLNTAQAVGAACIKPGIDGTAPGSAAICNEGALTFGNNKVDPGDDGREPQGICTTGAVNAGVSTEPEGPTGKPDCVLTFGEEEPKPEKDGAVVGCVEPGSGNGTAATGPMPQNDCELKHGEGEPTKAEKIGLDEAGIRRVLQSLLSARGDTGRRIIYLRAANRLDSGPSAEEVRQAVSEYKVNEIRENEKGPLFHYHQTEAGNLDGILEQDGLLAYTEQKKLGIAGKAGGSRPDAVQFTRDSYDADGGLVKRGLVGGNEVGVDDGIALVYGDDLMDAEGYDSLDTYPAIAKATTDKLHAVIVSDPSQIETVKAKLAAKGINATVTTRDQWTNEHYHHVAA